MTTEVLFNPEDFKSALTYERVQSLYAAEAAVDVAIPDTEAEG